MFERTPYATREGMRIQLEQAPAVNPASKIAVNDIVDDSIVREIEKEGFIDRLYR